MRRRPTPNRSGLLAAVAGLIVLFGAGCCGESRADEHGDHMRKPIPSPKELRELPPDGGPEYNRLVFEQSPYLLQHAATR